MKTLEETAPAEPVDWADAQIGRYKFRRLVGSGGMGVVVAAHDPELDREVAIKIIAGDEAERPIREAQAMAKLSHPNVVQVYEVIRLGDRTAIVMELVEGEELGAWQQGRPWREIIDAYAQACRGLAAAHREDIVHRDFKPSNALVDRDGVVRVSDFGLAHASADAPLDSAGTPAYMAPEQHRKGTVDARTDQWSVACALYEALYGKRPFEGADDLAAAVIRGELPPDGDSPLPRRVRAAIRRALSPKPDDRFETIEEFAAAITWKPRTTKFVLAGAALVIAGLAITLALTRRSGALACEGLDTPVTAVWTPETRSDLRARLLAREVGLSEATVDKALGTLDVYAANWTEMRTKTCVETQQGARSPEVLDARMRCLDRRLVTMSGLLESLSTGKPATLRAANDAITQLRPPVDCANETADTRPTDPALQAELDAGEDAVARATADRSLGQFTRMGALADRGVAAAERVGSASLLARALLLRGEAQTRNGKPHDGLETYRQAARAAAKARDQVLLASALSEVAFVEGVWLGRRSDGLLARPFIELAIEAGGRPDDVRATWLHYLAWMTWNNRAFAAEAAGYEKESIAIRKRTLPPNHAYTLESIETLGNIEAQLTHYDEAVRLHKQVLEARLASRGTSDMRVVSAYNSLAADELSRNNLIAALEYLQPAVEMSVRAGEPSKQVTYNLGITLLELGRWSKAASTFLEALALAETFSKESSDTADSASFAGICLLLSGDAERARPLILRGLEQSRTQAKNILSTMIVHAVLLALHDGDKVRARTLIDEAMKLPASNEPWRALGFALVVHAERGCSASLPLLKKMFDDSVASGDRSAQTVATAPLAECEIAAGNKASAKQRLEAELAWQIKSGSDEAARRPLQRLLQK